jgi:hypothetical protein
MSAPGLAARAKALSDELWNVNSRAEAVRWCSEADSILKEVARLFERPDVREAIAKATGRAS